MRHSEVARGIVYDIRPAWSASDMANVVFQRWIAGEIAAALRGAEARERFRVSVLLRQRIEAATSRETKEALQAVLKDVEEGKGYDEE